MWGGLCAEMAYLGGFGVLFYVIGHKKSQCCCFTEQKGVKTEPKGVNLVQTAHLSVKVIRKSKKKKKKMQLHLK